MNISVENPPYNFITNTILGKGEKVKVVAICSQMRDVYKMSTKPLNDHIRYN